MCLLCQDEFQILVSIPEKFIPLVTEPGCAPLDLSGGYPIDCACIWTEPKGKDFGGQFHAQAYHDVSSVLLGVATDQQWFNVLSSCADRYMSDHSDAFAAAHGLSTDRAPY